MSPGVTGGAGEEVRCRSPGVSEPLWQHLGERTRLPLGRGEFSGLRRGEARSVGRSRAQKEAWVESRIRIVGRYNMRRPAPLKGS